MVQSRHPVRYPKLARKVFLAHTVLFRPLFQLQSLPARVDRFHTFHQAYEKLDGPFAVPIKQCIDMYRDGYFPACTIMFT